MITTIKQSKQVSNDSLHHSQMNILFLQKKMMLIHIIHSYKRNNITLDELVQRVAEIKQNNYDLLPQNLKDIIDDIHSLSLVNNVLTDILLELTADIAKKRLYE